MTSVKRRSAAAGRWPNLHQDLLGEVYAMLESPVDRIRLAAACNSWRIFASTNARPVYPWLLLHPSRHDKTKRTRCYCPEKGTVLPYAPLPLVGRSVVGCYDGGWVAWYDDELGIMNLFTGVKVDLSSKQRRKLRIQYTTENTRKIIFSSPPTSNSCILAAITSTDDVAVCRLSHPEAGWSTRKYFQDRKLMDIAFYGGELYGLTRYSGRLTKINISLNKRGTLVLRTVVWATIPNPYPEEPFHQYDRYIVAAPGKLVTVTSDFDRSPSFTVFELVDEACSGMTNSTGKWVETTSLGDHALFLGATGSKSVHVVAGRHGGVRRNAIYYHHHSFSYYREEEIVRGNFDGIMSVGYHTYGADKPPLWLLPPDM
ncbi:hypothetical protein D1007_23551 [Hordeum vulgare]|nr:hypothetical protein D1007_23551 [Hordeum vulgare]